MTLQRSVGPGDHVFLIDGSSFVFRAYFQSLNQNAKYNARSDGLPTGAVRLFCTKVLQFLKDGAAGWKPSHIGLCFDPPDGSFRKALFEAYKANRPDPPADLVPQFPLVREAVRAFGLYPLEMANFEADDLIATYARQAQARGAKVLIISSDKDLMQLVGSGIQFYDFESGIKGKPGYRPERHLDEAAIIERWEGLKPSQIGDALALIGDASDNVPGIPGIGPKTAAQLILEYGDLETLLARADEIRQPKRREALLAHAKTARLSRRLVTLEENAPLPVPLDDLGIDGVLDPKVLVAFLKAMEFSALTKRVSEIYGVDTDRVEADFALTAGPAAEPNSGLSLLQSLPESLEVKPRPIDRALYECVLTLEQLDAWLARAAQTGVVAFDTETDSLDAMQARLVGFSLCTGENEACYVPLQHRSSEDLFGEGALPGQITLAEAIARLKIVLETSSILKIGHNIAYDALVLAQHGITITPLDDTMLLSYALDAGLNPHNMDDLSRRHLAHETIPFSEVTGTGKQAVTFDKVPLDKATTYAAEDAEVTFRLWRVLKPRLLREKRVSVYETLERPLVPVIVRMEERGITVDRAALSRLSGEFAQKLAALESEIHTLAGVSFSPGSPKQLGEILFGKLGLPGAKKTATGQWATGADVLEELSLQGHELPRKVLEWRQLAKLKSTYSDALPSHIHPRTQRVHTSFSLAATTTGRLSSSDPNLQNIPIRTEEGRKIRAAFVAEPGHVLISADYSQIELRILAHIADVPQLKAAFSEGIDIHAMTASEIFHVPLVHMDPMVRRRAKAINFGIVYGISAFGLANQLGISREEAGAYIKSYFERFPGIRDYMEETKRLCREQGFVKTLFGRVCHYPAIRSQNASERAGVERQAINAPIQGTAADIIRRAMIRMEEAVNTAGLRTAMLLQVHDELVFESPQDEAEQAVPVIRRVMENAALPAITFSVPLLVEARAARNWEEAH
jgi:DNA polymerase I